MKWIEMTVFTTEEGLDAVCARFDMLGISQVMIEQSREAIESFLNQSALYWDYADMDTIASGSPCVKAYVSEAGDNAALVRAAQESFASLLNEDVGIDLGSLNFSARLVDDEDWANNWKIYYKPIEIGSRLLVRPSWEEQPEGERVVLSLDPGMAFGTGSHPTTKMCLEFLEQTVKEGDKLLDMGCGSGILSIAGVLLGASHAIAVDIDPIADKIANENAALNNLDKEKYQVIIGDLLSDKELLNSIVEEGYELITANIVASVIIALMPVVKLALKSGGTFITSGIIDDRLNEVVESIKRAGLEVIEISYGGDWRAVLARKA